FTGTFSTATANLANGLFDFGNNTLDIGGAGSIVADTFSLTGGLLSGNRIDLNAAGNLTFTGGRLDVMTFNGTLNEGGGTLAAGDTAVGTTTVNGDYLLSAAGTLEIDLAGAGAGVGYDQLVVNGAVDLNGSGATGGMLDLLLAFAPQLNDTFVIIQNDGTDAILGDFLGLAEGSTVEQSFAGNVYSFSITYAGGDGNDVELAVTNIAASAPLPFAVQANRIGVAGDAAIMVAETGSAGDEPSLGDSGDETAVTGPDSDIVRFDGLFASLADSNARTDASVPEVTAVPEPSAPSLPEFGSQIDTDGSLGLGDPYGGFFPDSDAMHLLAVAGAQPIGSADLVLT
ncbi:MAG: hypothetical protein KDI53_12890, partial [Candidatus Accumulibacter sp.]|nr:hypothetical protein [Accumulibacter sp.]